jgi:hypothetical protein
MNQTMKDYGDFFKVVAKKQTYLNILYLLLSFPLGIAYFVFLVTGLSLGAGLLVLLVGAFIWLGVLLASKQLMIFERKLATLLLDTSFNEAPHSYNNEGVVRRLQLEVGDLNNWKALIYLFSKFVIGIFNFVVSVTLISVSIGLIFAPMLAIFFSNVSGYDISLYYNGWGEFLGLNWTLYEEIIIDALIGIVIGLLSLHFMNIMAYIQSKYLHIMSAKSIDELKISN